MKNKVIITLLALTMTAAMLAGCGKKETAKVPSEGTETVAEVSTETEKAVVVETETEESTEGAELVYNTEAETETEVVAKGEKSTGTKSEKTDSKKTDSKTETKNGKTDSTTNGSGTSSSGNTSNSTSTSGTNSGSASSENGGSGTSTTQPETSSEVAQEPQLESFPYPLDVLYDNGDGTGYMYAIDYGRCETPDEYTWEEELAHAEYEDGLEKQIEAAGMIGDKSEEIGGKYQQGFIKKIICRTYVPEPIHY